MKYLRKFTIEGTEYFFGYESEYDALVFDETDINHKGWIRLYEYSLNKLKEGEVIAIRDTFYTKVNQYLEQKHGKVDGEFDTPLEELLYRVANDFEVEGHQIKVKTDK